eukprot:PhM_4_TR16139/c3_g1_i10/m.88078/K03929/pnbA; para-nitrobenzyl esterase
MSASYTTLNMDQETVTIHINPKHEHEHHPQNPGTKRDGKYKRRTLFFVVYLLLIDITYGTVLALWLLVREYLLTKKCTVQFPCGKVTGKHFRDTKTTLFRGIPYATLRSAFADPAPVSEDTTREISATWWAPVALQPLSITSTAYPYILSIFKVLSKFVVAKVFTGQFYHGTMESATVLNVCTPDTKGKYPVMVWFHGGGFEYGSGCDNMYEPSKMAKRGVVVVTINYRLGVFGWLDVPGFTPNRGLLDQREALRWVNKYIGHFGGDAGNVTIFGESAGGMSVLTHLGTPSLVKEGLFHNAILQSPSNHLLSKADARNTTQRYAEVAGYRDIDELSRNLASIPIQKALSFSHTVTVEEAKRWHAAESSRIMMFTPVWGTSTMELHPLEAIRRHGVGNVRVLISHTNAENGFFLLPLQDARMHKHYPTDHDLEQRVASWLSLYQLGCSKKVPTTGERLLNAYRNGNMKDTMPYPQLWNAVHSDYIFRVACLHLAKLVHGHGKRVHVTRFDKQLRPKRFGAGHLVDLPFTFGNALRSYGIVGMSLTNMRVCHEMVTLWTDFAKGKEPHWDAWDPTTQTLLAVGYQDSSELKVLTKQGVPEFEAWDGVMECACDRA